MCDPVSAALGGTAILGAVQGRNQRRQAGRQQDQMQSQQQDAERQRQVQALEDRFTELQRQQQVQQGTSQIDQLFGAFGLNPLTPEGGFQGMNLPDQFDPNAAYVDQLLQSGGDFRSVFGGNPIGADVNRDPSSDFFNQRQQAFVDFAQPQFENQLQNQQRQLAFALTRSGLGQSSTAASRSQQLGEQATQGRQQIADQARQTAQQAQDQAMNARQDLVNMLQATGDPQQALAGAGQRVQSLQQQPAFNPLGQVFQGITENIGGFNQGQRRGASGLPLSGGFFNRNFTGGAGSSRIVGGG